MAIELSSAQLDALTVPEKVRLLEQLWQNLCSHPAEVSTLLGRKVDLLAPRRWFTGSDTCRSG
jgi:hypothetical protein